VGDSLRATGDYASALDHHLSVLDDEPDHGHCRLGLAHCLSRQPSLALRLPSDRHLLSLVTDTDLDPNLVMRAVGRWVRASPDPLGSPLLHAALAEGLVTDPATERLVVRARRDLCLGGDGPTPLAVALAAQCQLNEFVWPVTEEEQARLPAAADWVRAMYGEGRATCPDLAGTPASSDAGWTARVRAQYEARPYPRWQRLTCREPVTLAEHLSWVAEPGWAAPASLYSPDLLVAGCGTGRELLTAATWWRPASVTAFDLSSASVGVAREHAEVYGVDVDIRQADLHAFDPGRQFDVIVCTGVLHHLPDPMAGWRALRSMLRPGGVMWIGLYSARARAGVSAAGEEVRAAGLMPTPEGIRTARALVLGLERGHPARDCLALEDFYSLSGCRDLLMHELEHMYALPEIDAALESLGLTFLGFEVDAGLRHAQREETGPGSSLSAWHRFEELHPRTFLGMYQFWCQAST